MFLRPLVNTNESDYKYERLDVFTKHYIEEFDIVCLQEVFEGFNSFKATLISKASEVGFIDSAIPTRPGFFDSNAIDGGLVILSKFSIVESDSIVFKYCASDCILSSKGCIYAKVYVHGNFVHVFNTHLQASYYTTFETYKECINSRLYQCRELAKFIDLKTKDASSEDIIILCGDFNISSNVLSPVLIKQFTEFAHTDERFSIFLDPGFDSLKEYKTMIDLLSCNSFQIIDLKEHLNDENGGPPTFGGVEVDHDGIKFPIESVITGESDLMTNRALTTYSSLKGSTKSRYSRECWKTIKNLIEVEDNVELKEPFKSGSEFKNQDTNNEKFYVVKESTKIEKFPVNNFKFTHLSDHFGVSVKLNIL